ncbi:hypothetical protein GOBAR_AA05333 [Gossypium barbadense]|uniref:TIR domain-containing protein n=1 Tax=Gossypium barbadense TaxID=3634 RepID=A0A2P5YI72_GOSBA|nr:hypothetical protein GOBAR_AA05333 [Gossypium barbadense]
MSLLLSTSSSISRKKYDVFLSFRGEDTRKSFTDHLYHALNRTGIVTFRDDPKLEAGEEIAPELFKAIQQSWCSAHKVFPIFYHVDPSDLRKQKGKVEEAFAKQEERYKEDKDKIQKWRNALTEVANISGWHLNNRHESEFIKDIVKKISAKLCQTYPVVHDELVGISLPLEELYSKINIGEDDVRIIGICGMGGIGKTTLAKVAYAEMLPHFEGNDIISHRLSSKKVLVVLDYVDNIQHLKCLVGRRDWFNLGSRIIVTTRDEHLLRSYRIDDVYKPTTLNLNDALRLFNLKAFDGDTMPKYDFIELSEHVVRYANGLPLALEVLGSFSCNRDIVQWRSTIERLKEDPNKEILNTLRISFDGLEEKEKNIFLDIACFFNGEKKDLVMKVLDGCKFFLDIGIDVLIKKSLIKATEVIEGMIIDNKRESSKILNLSADTFLKMKNLRLLKVLSVSKCGDLKYLSNELRLLDWTGYPLRFLPSSFQPDNLVALLLPYSHIKQLWKGNRPLYKLKIINLKGSQNLIKTPDFTTASNLEVLILKGYAKLVDLHPSIGVLKSLKLLNLRDCKSLRSLLTKIEMESLEALILSGCSSLVRFPDIDEKMERLKTLDLSGCYRVENLLENLQQSKFRPNLSSLFKVFQGKRTTPMASMLPLLSGLSSLRRLNLRDCNLCEGDILRDISGLSSLTDLDLSGNNFSSIPASLIGLSKLGFLTLSNCNMCTLGEADIQSYISGLSSLVHLNLSVNNFINIPASLTRLSKL